MNQFSDEQYMTIKNDAKLLERFLAGLHRVARLALGFSPMQVDGKNVLLWGGAFPTTGYVQLGELSAYVCFTSDYLDRIIKEMRRLGYDDEDISAVRSNDEIQEPLTTLIGEYWPEMFEYAKSNARYRSDWAAVKAA